MCQSHTFTEPMIYRGWPISFDYPPIPVRSFDYSATHPDFDGPEDGRYVQGASLAEIRAEIDAWIEEHDEIDCMRSRIAAGKAVML